MFQICIRMLHKRRKVRVFVWKGIQKNIISYYSSAFITNPQPRHRSVCSQSILLHSNPVRKQDYKNNSCTQFAREVVGLWPIYSLYKKNVNCLLENLLKRSLCGGARWWPFDLLPWPFHPSCFLKKGVGRQHKTSTSSQNVWKCCLPCRNVKLFIAAKEAGFTVL